MKPGDTFLVPDGIGAHLNCVIAVLADGRVVMCHFTTCHRRSDRTCVIRQGEHPFFDKSESVVRYDQIIVYAPGQQLEALGRLIAKRFEPLSPELLERVKRGALNSPQTAEKIKQLLESV